MSLATGWTESSSFWITWLEVLNFTTLLKCNCFLVQWVYLKTRPAESMATTQHDRRCHTAVSTDAAAIHCADSSEKQGQDVENMTILIQLHQCGLFYRTPSSCISKPVPIPHTPDVPNIVALVHLIQNDHKTWLSSSDSNWFTCQTIPLLPSLYPLCLSTAGSSWSYPSFLAPAGQCPKLSPLQPGGMKQPVYCRTSHSIDTFLSPVTQIYQ